MEKISKAFREILRDLGLEKAVKVDVIREQWPHIIGDTISIHTSPSFFNNGELTIHVDSPEWLHELQYHKEEVLNKLESYKISKVRFKLGKIERRSARTAVAQRRTRRLTVHEADFVDETTAHVENQALKEHIRRAIEKSIGSR